MSGEGAGTSAGLATILSHGGSLGTLGGASLSIPMPFESKIVLYESMRIAGTAHVEAIDELVASMPEDATVSLIREPDNLADQWAIRVEYGGKRLGFVPADRNEVLARLMDGGKTLRGEVLDREKVGRWWKLHMEVSLVD
ncbi:HIRAN domain-containing protein [Caniella muris]|uniref:HIRAN domain-containing protein n=1 Tax=Caniella muris TaxID=2941502 RepID=UPI002040A5AF|nr:HIRAN domain-containing protein [Caniella muris]